MNAARTLGWEIPASAQAGDRDCATKALVFALDTGATPYVHSRAEALIQAT